MDVRTGTSFAKDGETGSVVDRLPPGLSCVETAADRTCLEAYLVAIRRAQELDRGQIRQHTAETFATKLIVDGLVDALDAVRLLA